MPWIHSTWWNLFLPWRWQWRMYPVIGAAIILLPVTIILLILITAASPHDWAHPNFARYTIDQREWLQKQRRPNTRLACCNEADGDQVEEDIRKDGHYWIRSVKTKGVWVSVPHEAVILEGNMIGHPIAWFRWVSNNGSYSMHPRDDMKLEVFCYAPGAKG